MDSQLEQLMLALESAVAGMSKEQQGWHIPGKWCAAEILEHLYLTYTGTIHGLERVLALGKPLATRASLRQRMRIFVVIRLGYMPEGRKSPALALPKGLDREMVQRDMAAKMAIMDAIIAKCEARFGRRVPLLDHPILGPLTGSQWRRLHLVHGKHHRKQILLLRKML